VLLLMPAVWSTYSGLLRRIDAHDERVVPHRSAGIGEGRYPLADPTHAERSRRSVRDWVASR
jgi:hypothetical protein